MQHSRIIIILLSPLVLALLMGASALHRGQKLVAYVEPSFSYRSDNDFIDKAAINRIIGADDRVVGYPVSEVRLNQIEEHIVNTGYAERVEAWLDSQCTLRVNIAVRRPVARLIDAHGRSAYIDRHGVKMPLSEKFTARCLVLSGPFTERLDTTGTVQDTNLVKLLPLLTFIQRSTFLSAQFSEIVADSLNNLMIYPQLGRTRINFGSPEQFIPKLNGLHTFYRKICPVKGWETYREVKLGYRNQLVCVR
jgi:cell division protein FtsQ